MPNPERRVRLPLTRLLRGSLPALRATGAALILASCAGASSDAARSSGPEPQASIQELMDAKLDPAADVLWGAVGSTVTSAGEVDRAPRSDEDWSAARRSAVTLIEATNLLTMRGRHAAPPGARATAEGELTHAQIDQLLRSRPEAFAGFARALRATGLQALAAIDARDPNALMDAGSAIEEACEACHLTFWYPGGAKSGR